MSSTSDHATTSWESYFRFNSISYPVITIKVHIKHWEGFSIISALIDSGAECNFIDQGLVVEIHLDTYILLHNHCHHSLHHIHNPQISWAEREIICGSLHCHVECLRTQATASDCIHLHHVECPTCYHMFHDVFSKASGLPQHHAYKDLMTGNTSPLNHIYCW